MPYPVDRPYSYAVPPELAVFPGQRVKVPFGRGNKTTDAVVISAGDGDVSRPLKSVLSVTDPEPVADEDAVKLALWLSARFFCTVYDALNAMLPGGLSKTAKSGRKRAPAAEPEPPAEYRPGGDVELNAEQNAAYEGLKRKLGRSGCALLQGVTGSGKTRVYLKLLLDVFESGGGAIALVPEISLTPQLTALFREYFGAEVMHSSLSAEARLSAWRRVRSGESRVVVGTRSAIFAPVKNLKLIIIDEEQEHTYKSEGSPRYDARDVAKYLCGVHDAPLVFASATPSVETAYAARSGKYAYFKLNRRYNEGELPAVTMADSREDLRAGNFYAVGAVLRSEILLNLERGEQTLLFLNRRGYRRACVCPDCGKTRMCPNCSVALTLHAPDNSLRCHCCGYHTRHDGFCPDCNVPERFFGIGTQKAEDDLKTLFPGAEVMRMDADTTGKRDAHEKMLARFKRENIPLLIGTQMIAKGLNLPNVTLVGVLDADMSLFIPDFRADERTFGLISQVIGRAGRADKPGRAVIQTFQPRNRLLEYAARQDYESFFAGEILCRERRGLPPFGEILLVRVFGAERERLHGAAHALRGELIETLSAFHVRVLGPAPAATFKADNVFRFQITLSGGIDRRVRAAVAALMRAFPGRKENRGVNVYADLNPNGF